MIGAEMLKKTEEREILEMNSCESKQEKREKEREREEEEEEEGVMKDKLEREREEEEEEDIRDGVDGVRMVGCERMIDEEDIFRSVCEEERRD